MRKNRIMAIAIMVIVIVILSNFDKSAGKVVYDSQSITEAEKKVDYKYIKLSYSDDTSTEYLKLLDDVIKNLPAEVISDISEKGYEIRVTDKENMEISDSQDKVILIRANSNKSEIRQDILKGHETQVRKEEMKNDK